LGIQIKADGILPSRSDSQGPIECQQKGVKVEVILDKSQKREKYSSADFLVNSGIPTKIDSSHAIAHNKVMVIDAETLIPSNFNFTRAAEENNAGNLFPIRDKTLARRYLENWQEHAQHSELYAGKGR
jgi:phosphatidylserine/phosphatidylglycerophosphate/cardiolipin synthase-like enzyme